MEEGINMWLIGGGLAIGALLGVIVQRSKFCMAAAVSNLVLMRDYRQLHAYLASIAVAISGAQLLDLTGLIELNASGYRSAQINWLGAMIGGLVFGFGTMLAGGCVGRTLVRVGEGNLGALIALGAIAFAAAMTLYGFVEPLRIWLSTRNSFSVESGDASFSSVLQLPAALTTTMLVTACLLLILFVGKRSRSTGLLLAGAGIGLLVVAGWAITGYFSQDLFSLHRPSSLSYAGPLANTSVVITTGSLLGMSTQFGIALVVGTIAGAILISVITHSFKWTLPDKKHVAHLLVGGSFMGFGAILAGGCNIGQGLSGLSTGSIQSLIAVLAIALGMRLGVAWLMKTELSDKPLPVFTFFQRVLRI